MEKRFVLYVDSVTLPESSKRVIEGCEAAIISLNKLTKNSGSNSVFGFEVFDILGDAARFAQDLASRAAQGIYDVSCEVGPRFLDVAVDAVNQYGMRIASDFNLMPEQLKTLKSKQFQFIYNSIKKDKSNIDKFVKTHTFTKKEKDLKIERNQSQSQPQFQPQSQSQPQSQIQNGLYFNNFDFGNNNNYQQQQQQEEEQQQQPLNAKQRRRMLLQKGNNNNNNNLLQQVQQVQQVQKATPNFIGALVALGNAVLTAIGIADSIVTPIINIGTSVGSTVGNEVVKIIGNDEDYTSFITDTIGNAKKLVVERFTSDGTKLQLNDEELVEEYKKVITEAVSMCSINENIISTVYDAEDQYSFLTAAFDVLKTNDKNVGIVFTKRESADKIYNELGGSSLAKFSIYAGSINTVTSGDQDIGYDMMTTNKYLNENSVSGSNAIEYQRLPDVFGKTGPLEQKTSTITVQGYGVVELLESQRKYSTVQVSEFLDNSDIFNPIYYKTVNDYTGSFGENQDVLGNDELETLKYIASTNQNKVQDLQDTVSFIKQQNDDLGLSKKSKFEKKVKKFMKLNKK